MLKNKYTLKQGSDYIQIFKNDSLFIKCKREVNWYGKITTFVYYEDKLILKASQFVYLFNQRKEFNIEHNSLPKVVSFLKNSNKLKIEKNIFEKINYGFIFKLSYNVLLNGTQICNCKYVNKILSFSTIVEYEIEFYKND